jgi:FkbM family methyltransferase
MYKRIRTKVKREALKHFPRWILRDKFMRPHYSQFGEDVIIAGLFDRHYRGFYVDVGAHHPRFLSNTYLLWLRNWSGINIDADPSAIDAFNRERPTDTNLCCAVGSSAQTGRFYQFNNPAFNTLSEEILASEPQRGTPISTLDVVMRPLNDILSEYVSQPIDYLNVDVEGMDNEVLASFDFARFAPRVISVEMADVDFDQIAYQPTYKILRDNGYDLIAYCSMTGIFCGRAGLPSAR